MQVIKYYYMPYPLFFQTILNDIYTVSKNTENTVTIHETPPKTSKLDSEINSQFRDFHFKPLLSLNTKTWSIHFPPFN